MKVPITYQGETIKEYELPDGIDEETVKEIQNGIQKGILYDKKMHEMSKQEKDLKSREQELIDRSTQLDRINSLMEKAKTDDDFFNTQFKPLMEKELGRSLTQKEEEAFDEDISSNPVIKSLVNQLNDISEQLKGSRETQIIGEINTVNKKLEGKYDGKNGYPKYDRESVQKYIEDEQFYHPNIETNYEKAYLLMNWDKIQEVEKKNITREQNIHDINETKIRDGSSAMDLPKGKRPQTYEEAEEMILKEMRESGRRITK